MRIACHSASVKGRLPVSWRAVRWRRTSLDGCVANHSRVMPPRPAGFDAGASVAPVRPSVRAKNRLSASSRRPALVSISIAVASAASVFCPEYRVKCRLANRYLGSWTFSEETKKSGLRRLISGFVRLPGLFQRCMFLIRVMKSGYPVGKDSVIH